MKRGIVEAKYLSQLKVLLTPLINKVCDLQRWAI
jgi:hypothetical protein